MPEDFTPLEGLVNTAGTGAHRAVLIEMYIDELTSSLGGVQPTVSVKNAELRALHVAQDYAGMINFVRKSFRLETKIRLGLVNSGGPAQAPAWVEMPERLPYFGSEAFKKMTFTVFIRKSFLQISPAESVVVAMAHELSHIILDSVGHRLRRTEPAVDLTAMILGYRDFYLNNRSMIGSDASILERLGHMFNELFLTQDKKRELGYLSNEEIIYASNLIIKHCRS